jgi:hypothetical protein
MQMRPDPVEVAAIRRDDRRAAPRVRSITGTAMVDDGARPMLGTSQVPDRPKPVTSVAARSRHRGLGGVG